MAREPEQGRKDWYKISVDTVRGWMIAVVFAVLGIAGYWVYGAFEVRYLERKVGTTIQEARELLQRVRDEPAASTYRDEYESAASSLRSAREESADQNYKSALHYAESSRMVLTSVLRAIKRIDYSGEAQFISVRGDVEFRRGERGEWRRARSRDPLHAGDYVKTTDGSAEIMSVDGTVYSVRPNTTIVVGQTSYLSGDVAERSIQLDHGWVDLSTSLARSTVQTPDAEALVEVESNAVVAYEAEEQVGRFATYRGSMDVSTADGESRRVGTLQHLAQKAGLLAQPKRLPPAPRAVEPANDLELDLSSFSQVVLNWQSVAGSERYALQVAHNRLFVNTLIDVQDRDSTQATLGLRGDGTFVWRVAAFTEDGVQGPWSTPRTFRVKPTEPSGADELPIALPTGKVEPSAGDT